MIEAGAFCLLPDGRMAVGTRHGEIYILSGIDEKKPNPSYHLYATGLDEIFGLAYKDDAFYVTQSCELTRVTDTKRDGKANRFETISDAWGYANYHEYAFGSKFDKDGNLHVALGLSYSYESHALFRGFAMKITPEGKTRAHRQRTAQPGRHRAQRTWGAVLHRKPGAVELLVQPEGRHPGQLSRAPRELQLVQVRAGTGPGSHHAQVRLADHHREGPREATRPLRGDLSLHPHGPVDHGLRRGPHERQVRAVRGSDVPRRLHALDHHAGHDRASERRVAGRVLPVPRGAFDRHPERRVHAEGQSALRRDESRLAGPRHQAVRPGTTRLERQDAVRDQAHHHRTRRASRSRSRNRSMPRRAGTPGRIALPRSPIPTTRGMAVRKSSKRSRSSRASNSPTTACPRPWSWTN